MKTAILVDGGFYRKRAKHLWGDKTAEERANELIAYCMAHMNKKDGKDKYDPPNLEGRSTISFVEYHELTDIWRDNIVEG